MASVSSPVTWRSDFYLTELFYSVYKGLAHSRRLEVCIYSMFLCAQARLYNSTSGELAAQTGHWPRPSGGARPSWSCPGSLCMGFRSVCTSLPSKWGNEWHNCSIRRGTLCPSLSCAERGTKWPRPELGEKRWCSHAALVPQMPSQPKELVSGSRCPFT